MSKSKKKLNSAYVLFAHSFTLYVNVHLLLLGARTRGVAQEEVADCGRLVLRRKRSWRDQTHGGQSLAVVLQHIALRNIKRLQTLPQSHRSSVVFDARISLKLRSHIFKTLAPLFVPREYIFFLIATKTNHGLSGCDGFLPAVLLLGRITLLGENC